MKNHIAFKALALFLATVLLLAALGSAAGIALLIGMDLYEITVDEAYENQMWSERRSLAVDLVYTYATLQLGKIPSQYYSEYYGYDWQDQDFHTGFYFYSIFDENGIMVESTASQVSSDTSYYEIVVTDIIYRRLISNPAEAVDGKTTFSDNYFDPINDCYVEIAYQQEDLPDYTVQLYLLPGAYSYDTSWQVLQALYSLRYQLFWILGAAVICFLAIFIYLGCAAGRKPGSDQVRAGGLNRLPLDLYTAGVVGVIFLTVALVSEIFNPMIYDTPQLFICFLLVLGSINSFAVVGLLFAWIAQIKMPHYYWIKHTLVGIVIRLILRCLRGIFRGISATLQLLPVMWQWILTAALMGLVPLVLLWTYWETYDGFFLGLLVLALLADVAIILYSSYCFGTLMKGAQRMSRGNLQEKVSYKYLLGYFRAFAIYLNSMSNATQIAAEKQLRSERMKTELITNVSHDIKTPLTSIINFVDLLQKPHSDAQEQEYLEVLSRQSAQMKKLIEDLMELSKANSGNISVNLEKVDAAEAVNQALGEFSDKLEAVGLTPVFHQPETPVYMTADGRHLWRVLFNLLTNAVKYALPGTRLYIDLTQAGGSVILSMKNISRAALNISADELLERFVQGDTSRKTEGSGLGLNIAKSLMEVQNGHLELLLDGDLFKVTLTFPAAEE